MNLTVPCFRENANRVLTEIMSKDGEGEVRRVHLLSREEIIRQVIMLGNSTI